MQNRRQSCGCKHTSDYRAAVARALVDSFRLPTRRARRLVEKWHRLVDSRREIARSPLSTAEHVARFEQAHVVRPYDRDPPARSRRSAWYLFESLTPRARRFVEALGAAMDAALTREWRALGEAEQAEVAELLLAL